MRRDAKRTRDRLLVATGELLESVGPNFTLPDLARQAGVGVATVYRHFTDTAQAHAEFERRTVADLLAEFGRLPPDLDSMQRFERMCIVWVRRSQSEGAAARFIRSPHGFLERTDTEIDAPIHALAVALRAALQGLVDDAVIPEQDLEVASLIWITLFDERVVIDLTRALHWTTTHTSRHLGESLLGALGRS